MTKKEFKEKYKKYFKFKINYFPFLEKYNIEVKKFYINDFDLNLFINFIQDFKNNKIELEKKEINKYIKSYY